MFGRPDMPSPSASSGSASARMSSAGIASRSPMPMVAGPTRGDIVTSACSGPKASFLYRVGGLAERVRRPVWVLAGHLLVLDADTALGRNAEDAPVLQLPAVRGVVHGAVRAGNVEPQQQAALGVVVVVGRLRATVVRVTRRAGEGVERRAQPVACLRRRRRGYPVLVEEAVPHLEHPPLLVREIARGELEGVGSLAERRRLAPETFVEQQRLVYPVVL